MENLRWILIFAGIAILVLLYFSGRPKSERTSHQRSLSGGGKASNRSSSGRTSSSRAGRSTLPQEEPLGDFDPRTNDFVQQGQAAQSDPLLGETTSPMRSPDQFSAFDNVDPDDFVRPGAQTQQPYDYPEEFNLGDDHGRSGQSGFSNLAQKIEAFSERLSPKRKQRIAASSPADIEEMSSSENENASKIVTLHVVAPPNQLIPGDRLLDVFEGRGYHYGDMNIFHSMHEGTIVFSVAKMIEPGYFDINNIESFQTPGITLIMQLPGPVPADVAFEVLISEAFEMASVLNATVLDEQHSSMTKQTIQHMREGIYEYMHRQKYFGTVAS